MSIRTIKDGICRIQTSGLVMFFFSHGQHFLYLLLDYDYRCEASTSKISMDGWWMVVEIVRPVSDTLRMHLQTAQLWLSCTIKQDRLCVRLLLRHMACNKWEHCPRIGSSCLLDHHKGIETWAPQSSTDFRTLAAFTIYTLESTKRKYISATSSNIRMVLDCACRTNGPMAGRNLFYQNMLTSTKKAEKGRNTAEIGRNT